MVLEGHLYGWFGYYRGGLYEYNLEDYAWEATGVKFSDSDNRVYCDGHGSFDLVVAHNRLFLMRQRQVIDQNSREQVERRDFFRSGRSGGRRSWHNTFQKETTTSWLLDISEISLR